MYSIILLATDKAKSQREVLILMQDIDTYELHLPQVLAITANTIR
jgi:hypothetical protein